jgi:hypothetical protein
VKEEEEEEIEEKEMISFVHFYKQNMTMRKRRKAPSTKR